MEDCVITNDELKEKMRKHENILLLDVREEWEYEEAMRRIGAFL